MKRTLAAVLISILVHLLLLVLIPVPEPVYRLPVQVRIEYPEISGPSASSALSPEKQPALPEQADAVSPPVPREQNAVVPLPGWKAFTDETRKRLSFLNQETPASPDTFLTIPPVPPAPRPGDDVVEWLQRREGWSRTPAIESSDTREGSDIEPRFDFIPSRAQIEALAYLFRNDEATQIDLYAHLDPAAGVTAAHFDDELAFLVRKGFVTRKKISPQNILMAGAAGFAVPIELSRKNRLNPVWDYRPRVDRIRLRHYLQSRLFLLEERFKTSPSDSSLSEEIRSVKTVLSILVESFI